MRVLLILAIGTSSSEVFIGTIVFVVRTSVWGERPNCARLSLFVGFHVHGITRRFCRLQSHQCNVVHSFRQPPSFPTKHDLDVDSDATRKWSKKRRHGNHTKHDVTWIAPLHCGLWWSNLFHGWFDQASWGLFGPLWAIFNNERTNHENVRRTNKHPLHTKLARQPILHHGFA